MAENVNQLESDPKFDLVLTVIMSLGISACCAFTWGFISFGTLGIVAMAIIALGGVITGFVLGLIGDYYKAPWWISISATFFALIIGSIMAIMAALIIRFTSYSPLIFAGLIVFCSIAVACFPGGAWVYTAARRQNSQDPQNP